MQIDIFLRARKTLGKTQKEIAELLGLSLKAVNSYEQGWRTIPPYVERQILFLLSRRHGNGASSKACWVLKKCPPARKKNCPAYEFSAGNFCWLVNGTMCECKIQKNWQEKMEICRQCVVVKSFT